MPDSNNKIIDVIGFPMDLGADRRGVDMGPSALRIADIEDKLIALGYNVNDLGDVFIKNRERQEITNQKLKYLDEIVATSEELARITENSLLNNHFPLCLGGDHSIALGSIAGISSYCKKNKIEPGVIWIDAHADINTDVTTPSGNIHGMPVAASIGLGNEKLVKIFGFTPKVKPENFVLIGLRSIDKYEKEIIKQTGVTVYTMSEIDKLGIHRIIARVLKDLKLRVQHIHLSFDLDSVDPSVAPGVGTPVPGGLSYREAHLLMEAIAECGCLSSLEIAEVNPILDNKNQSASFAAELVASCMGMRIL